MLRLLVGCTIHNPWNRTINFITTPVYFIWCISGFVAMTDESKENKTVQRTVNLSIGLSDVVDEEALIEIRNENRRKSTVDMGLGLNRMNSTDDDELKVPGNPMLKIGLEVADGQDTNESKGSEDLLSMVDIMSALGNDSLEGEGEAWESKKETRNSRANTECHNIMEQLGFSNADMAASNDASECWEKKASGEDAQAKQDAASATCPVTSDSSVFAMLGLSESDAQSTGEAWESKTIV